jgi:CheY-like chemotaxis protein
MLGLDFPRRGISKPKIMPTAVAKKVLAVLDDLFFTVKINEAAKRAGLSVKFVKSQRDALDQAAEGAVLIILDLNFGAIQPVELIQKFKADPNLQKINLVGYVSHVQGELKQEAQEAGCDMVMARSVFSQSLRQIMKRHAN